MRKTRPYGLPPWWLEPTKVVTDPIHGDVFVTRLEQYLLDAPPMQRLRRVRQLGTTHLVYPGATHTRFAHSLGAVRVVQTLLDTAIDQRDGNHPEPDLFQEWEREAHERAGAVGADSPDAALAEDLGEKPWRVLFLRRVAEATVLARLGALLHDIAHLPYGHTIEDDLRLLLPHDSGRPRFKLIWKEVLRSCERQVNAAATRREEPGAISERLAGLDPLRTSGALYADLQYLILSSERDKEGNKIEAAKKIQYPFVADMVGNTICADLLDYLQRDHVFTGLPVRLGKRYLSSFYITPVSSGDLYKERMALLTHRKGSERQDIVSEILKHLRYRYELQERVLVHHTKLAADAMVGKMFELWIDSKQADLRADQNLWEEAKQRMNKRFAYRRKETEEGDEIERVAHAELELLLRTHGDDGVLEQIAGGQESEDAAELARALLNRELYKPAADAVGASAAEDLYEEYGSLEKRREIEHFACDRAEIPHTDLVLWIPDPEMRLKLAELLVNNGRGIAKFKDTFRQGSDIYDAHKALWKISVFVHPRVTNRQASAALAHLGQKLAVSWSTHTAELGPDPALAPEHLAATRALKTLETDSRVEKVIRLAKEQLPARGGAAKTQAELDNHILGVAEALGYLDPNAEPPSQF